MQSRLLIDMLWFAGGIVFLGVAATMSRRNLRKSYPIFFCYVVFESIISLLLRVTFAHYNVYFFVYWAAAALMVALSFGVIYEIFRHVFEPFPSLRRLAMVLFRWAGLILLMIAVVTALSGSRSNWEGFMAVIFCLTRSVCVMMVGLVLLLFLFSEQVGISSEHRVFGIALGFGVSSAVELIMVTMVATKGMIVVPSYSMARFAALVISGGVWLRYMLADEPKRVHRAEVEARNWDFALARANTGTPALVPQAEPFLPFIESAVDRILKERLTKEHTNSE